jgi:carbamate kinase
LKVLVSLGGNAILRHGEKGTADEQAANVRSTSKQLVRLVQGGAKLAITHGNGPQVGNILLQNELARAEIPAMPLDICGAESQGMIGYLLEVGLESELKRAGLDAPVSAIVTRVAVDPLDAAFRRPTKPVGPFYGETEAARLREERGWQITSDSGRGYRRVVPSPKPLDILEKKIIRRLYDAGTIVVSAGGGGVPVVVNEKGEIYGVEAVLDKDRTAALLATVLGVETLLILTDVERVYLNYGTHDERPLNSLGLEECRRYLDEGQFPSGSMGPKIEGAVSFLEAGGVRAIIASLDNAERALNGESGTLIER